MSSQNAQPVGEVKSELSWSEIEGSLLRGTTVLRQVLRIASNLVASYLKITQTLVANESSMLRLTLSLTRRGTKVELKARLSIQPPVPVSSARNSSRRRGS